MASRVVFAEPRRVELERVRVPVPGPGEALVRGEWSLVSTGTEMTAYTGDFPRDGSAWARYVRYPFPPGYSSVGVVHAVGDGCALTPGQRVAAESEHASHFLLRGPGLAVPKEVPAEQAAFHTVARIVLNGLRLSRLEFGESAAVVGCGLLGQLAVRLLRVAGAYPVVALDLERRRLAQAEQSGADARICPADQDPVAALRDCNGGRLADLVIDVTGAPGSFPLATRLARYLGRVVLLGSPRGAVTVDLHDDVHSRGLQVIGAHAGTTPRQETPHTQWTMRRNVEYFFALLRGGRLRVDDLITHRFPLSRAGEAYAMLERDRAQAMGVLLQLNL